MSWKLVAQQQRDAYCDCGAKMHLKVVPHPSVPELTFVRLQCRRCRQLAIPRADEVRMVKVQA